MERYEQMNNNSMVIKVPAERNWKTLADVRKVYSETEITEIVTRYCDQMELRKEYRNKRNAEQRRILAWAKENMPVGTRVDMSSDQEEEA